MSFFQFGVLAYVSLSALGLIYLWRMSRDVLDEEDLWPEITRERRRSQKAHSGRSRFRFSVRSLPAPASPQIHSLAPGAYYKWGPEQFPYSADLARVTAVDPGEGESHWAH